MAEDIEKVTYMAYPVACASILEMLTKDQFLPDEKMRLHIRPGNIHEALKVALQFESYQLANCQRQKSVRMARTFRSPGCTQTFQLET